MPLTLVRTTIETENDCRISLLIIGRTPLQLASIFLNYINKLTSEPTQIHTHLIDSDCDVKTTKGHIQSAYIDDYEILIGTTEQTEVKTFEELKTVDAVVAFLKAMDKGYISNDYLDQIHLKLGDEQPKSPWKDRNSEEAPKTGETFYAIDSVHGVVLHTVFWDGQDFMTDNESWSGNFRLWMHAIEKPENYFF